MPKISLYKAAAVWRMVIQSIQRMSPVVTIILKIPKKNN